MSNNKDYCFRVISNQVRFGCGYRTINGKIQYFAWHGYPDRNDDYFTTSEISESEFNEIQKNTPRKSSPIEKRRRFSATGMSTIIL